MRGKSPHDLILFCEHSELQNNDEARLAEDTINQDINIHLSEISVDFGYRSSLIQSIYLFQRSLQKHQE